MLSSSSLFVSTSRKVATTGVAVVFAATMIAAPGSAMRQAESVPSTPSADFCTVAPLETPVWDGQEPEMEPTAPVSVDGPFVPPIGAAASQDQVDGVTETVVQSIACENAGDLAQMLALFSPDAVRSFFSGPRGFDAEAVDATIEAGPVAPGEDRRIALVAIESVVVLDDGRIGATVTTAAEDLEYVDFLYFIEGTTPDGESRWLIDNSVAINSQTQVEGEATEIP